MDFAAFEDLIKQRRSIRYFSNTPVSKAQVMQLLDAARLAPSIQNMQPWHFHVIFNDQMRQQLQDECCYGNFVEGSSVFIVATCDSTLQSTAPEIVWNIRELEDSCMAAMMYVILGATAMGLGSCWVSLHHGPVHDLLDLPVSDRVVGGIMLGNFKKGDETSGGYFERKSLEDSVTVYE